MAGELSIFSNGEFGQVRTVVSNGELWFVAKDIADSLEYAESSNTARLFQAVPEEWKGMKQIHTLGGLQNVICLSEQGLYFFLGRSDKPKALPYQKWIAGEVVPSIRKTGRYSAHFQKDDLSAKLEIAKIILGAAGLNSNQIALGLDNIARKSLGESILQESQIALPAPAQKAMLTPTQLGREIGGLSAKKVNQKLIDAGLQRRLVSGQLELTDAGQSYGVMLDTGKKHNSGSPVVQIKWYSSVIDMIK